MSGTGKKKRRTPAAASSGPKARAAPGGGGDGGGSQATQLLNLVEGDRIELFHSPEGGDGGCYATFPSGSHQETWPIASAGFKKWLSHRYFREYRRVAGAQALADAITALAGQALHEGPALRVHVRVAECGDAIWLDLCDEQWRAVRITAAGWEIVERDVPVKFIRRGGMGGLPVPERGGSLLELRGLLNVPDDDLWMLAVGWLVGAVRPGRPFAVLNVTGEQGSAKSTFSKMLRSIIDPASPLLRRPPKDDRDLMIAAGNSWIVGYDNISRISEALSDSLCSLATGGGFGTRKLHTDDDEKAFDATRPVLLNSIEDAVTRPDLLQRAINLHLPTIPDAMRREEDELWQQFRAHHPRVLGALLDAVSAGLRNIKSVRLSEKPRMADFAVWVCAAEPALPWPEGAFMRAYRGNLEAAHSVAVESSLVAAPILAMVGRQGAWSGPLTELLATLNARHVEDPVRRLKDWPKTAKALGASIRRIAPSLRGLGIHVGVPTARTGRNKARIYELRLADAAHGPHVAARSPDQRAASAAPETGSQGLPGQPAAHAALAARCLPPSSAPAPSSAPRALAFPDMAASIVVVDESPQPHGHRSP